MPLGPPPRSGGLFPLPATSAHPTATGQPAAHILTLPTRLQHHKYLAQRAGLAHKHPGPPAEGPGDAEGPPRLPGPVPSCEGGTGI